MLKVVARVFTESKPNSESKVNILSSITSARLLEIYDMNLDVDLFINNKSIDQYMQHII